MTTPELTYRALGHLLELPNSVHWRQGKQAVKSVAWGHIYSKSYIHSQVKPKPDHSVSNLELTIGVQGWDGLDFGSSALGDYKASISHWPGLISGSSSWTSWSLFNRRKSSVFTVTKPKCLFWPGYLSIQTSYTKSSYYRMTQPGSWGFILEGSQPEIQPVQNTVRSGSPRATAMDSGWWVPRASTHLGQSHYFLVLGSEIILGFPGGAVVKNLPANAGEGNGNPLQYSCLGNPMDRGACWTTVHRVAKIQTRQSMQLQ